MIKTMPPSIDRVSPPPEEIRRFFDSVASRYDLLNSVLSCRLDQLWRRKACDRVLDGTEKSLLDLGVGTGKFIRFFVSKQSWERIVGLDFSQEMLKRARRELPETVKLVNGDFRCLPFRPGSFDLIISSFALRSVNQMESFLAQVYELLSVHGKAAFLCLTRPQNRLWNLVYRPYLKFYLPLVGGAVSRQKAAYDFLSHSILRFQDPEDTARRMERIGFGHVRLDRFTLGAATLILGFKNGQRRKD